MQCAAGVWLHTNGTFTIVISFVVKVSVLVGPYCKFSWYEVDIAVSVLSFFHANGIHLINNIIMFLHANEKYKMGMSHI